MRMDARHTSSDRLWNITESDERNHLIEYAIVTLLYGFEPVGCVVEDQFIMAIQTHHLNPTASFATAS